MAMGNGRFLLTISATFVLTYFLSQQFFYASYVSDSRNEYILGDYPILETQEVQTNSYDMVAVALPSIRISKEEDAKINRKIYGGVGDKPHLGGFTNIDYEGLSPEAWKLMIEFIGVKSLLDVGCGKGLSTTYFEYQGVNVTCVEGSHDAVSQSLLKPEKVIEHDFSRGPWWPSQTVDAVWCVEFLEHVGRQFHKNYFPSFKQAALVFASHSNWGGWHHVEVHSDDWWITKFETQGFIYSQYLTQMIRQASRKGISAQLPNGKNYLGHHITFKMLVFINPSVASLPEHHHLLAEPGCYDEDEKGRGLHVECNRNEESPLPDDFKPLNYSQAKHKEWESFITESLNLMEGG